MTLNHFLEAFIPIFVAMDAPGIVAIFFTLTEGMEPLERKRVLRHSVLTALIVPVVFIFVGQAVFRFLGIRVEDFSIAGGILLLVLAITDLIRQGEKTSFLPSDLVGVVPLGIPIIAGPATLTMTLILVGTHGLPLVLVALFLNVVLIWIIFSQADRIIKIIGISGSRAIAKVISVFLAAFAVSMIRNGIMGLIGRQ